ncbi:GppA Exopolyphosphatase [Acidimicrobiia bacterium]
MNTPVAAIDCGTNSVRLLITTDGKTQIERLMRITRLGQGVNATGRLDPAAIERTLTVLREFRAVIDKHGVTRIRMTATSAARDASNSDEFFVAARDVIGVDPELISGEEEGRLSFLGATADLNPDDGPFLVCDIGGGSTEFIFGTTEPEATISVDIGCVRMTEAWLHSDPPKPEELSQALSVIELHCDDVLRAIPQIGEAKTFVGLAGTVNAAAAVEIGMTTYDRDKVHHLRMTRAMVEDVFRTLATESVEERKDNPGLEPERADVIVGGMCVLVTVMRRFGLREMLVSESDILDGLAMSLLDGD